MPAKGRVAVKGLGSVIGLAGARVVNAWFYHTPLDVFIQRTVLTILLVYMISELRALRADMRAGRSRARDAGRKALRRRADTPGAR
jgi:hypothetical protein